MDQPTRTDPLDRARALAPEVAAAADDIEATRRFPEPLLSRLHEAGLFRLFLPRSLGGEQVAPGAYVAALEEVSRADASVGWNLFVANSAALIAPFIGRECAETIFADPRALIAWGPPTATACQAVPGGYRVSGTWGFASGCRQATWMGAHCRVREPDGSLRRGPNSTSVVLSLLFPAEQAILLDTWDTIGLRGTASDSYRLEDVFVPDGHTGTREDPAARNEPGPLYAFTQQGLYAVGVASVALGIAGAMLSAFVALAREKSTRGLNRLAETDRVRALIAESEARLGAGRAYLLATLDDVHAAADEWAPIDVEQRARVRLAATNAIQGAIAVADAVYKAAGVDAIVPGGPFERRFRDIHTLSQQIQSRDAHYEAVGRVLLGEPPAVFY